MEDLAFELSSVLQIRLRLEQGASLAQALRELQLLDHPQMGRAVYLQQLIQRGLKGDPILPALTELEQDLTERALSEIDRQTSTLPIWSLLPLLLFQFPAILLLMVGPVLESIVHSF